MDVRIDFPEQFCWHAEDADVFRKTFVATIRAAGLVERLRPASLTRSPARCSTTSGVGLSIPARRRGGVGGRIACFPELPPSAFRPSVSRSRPASALRIALLSRRIAHPYFALSSLIRAWKHWNFAYFFSDNLFEGFVSWCTGEALQGGGSCSQRDPLAPPRLCDREGPRDLSTFPFSGCLFRAAINSAPVASALSFTPRG